MIPEPTTVASSEKVPSHSAINLRIISLPYEVVSRFKSAQNRVESMFPPVTIVAITLPQMSIPPLRTAAMPTAAPPISVMIDRTPLRPAAPIEVRAVVVGPPPLVKTQA
jgi:hypothetical protein